MRELLSFRGFSNPPSLPQRTAVLSEGRDIHYWITHTSPKVHTPRHESELLMAELARKGRNKKSIKPNIAMGK
jgi:hypothetical protein